MTFYHVFLLNAALLTTTFSSKFGPPLPLPPADLPPPILPSFGPNYGAVPQGSRTAKSGKYHYPFYKFSIGTIMQSPAYRGCCRVCPEQFGIEVSLLLEVSSQQNVRESVRHRKGGDGGALASLGGAKGGAGAASPGGAAASPGGAAAKGGTAAKGGADAKAGGSKGGATAGAAVGGGGGSQAPLPPPTVPAPPHRDNSADVAALGNPSMGFGMMGIHTPTHGGVSGLSTNGFVSGPQAEALLPCCKVCPDQFLMPQSLEDVSTSFVEIETTVKGKTQAQTQTKTKTDTSRTLLNTRKLNTRKQKGFMKSAMKKSDMFRQFKNGPTTMDTKYNPMGQCCNLCDKRSMKPSSKLKLPFSFLEAMEVRTLEAKRRKRGTSTVLLEKNGEGSNRRKGFVSSLGAMAGAALGAMGSGGSPVIGFGCCPVCPNLQTIMNANVPQDEAFGGPFASAMESTNNDPPLTPEEKEALQEIADQAGVDTAQAGRDPGMAKAAKTRAAQSLLGGAALGALAGGLSSMRL